MRKSSRWLAPAGFRPTSQAPEAWLAALVPDSAQVQLTRSTEGDVFSLDTDAGWIGFLRP